MTLHSPSTITLTLLAINIDHIVLTFLHTTEPSTSFHGQSLRRGKRLRKPNRFLVTDHVLNAVLNSESGKLEEYRHLVKGPNAKEWLRRNTVEIARLYQGRNDKSYKGTNTIVFKHTSALPKGRKATYLRVVADQCPNK